MMDNVWRKGVLLVTVILIVSPVFATEHSDSGLDPSQAPSSVKEAEINNGVLEIEIPSDKYGYYKAYVAEKSDITEGGEIEDWEEVEVNADLRPPKGIWNVNLGEEPVLFSDSATIDFERHFEPGEYYVFPWVCGTHGISGGATVPDCGWYEPLYVEHGETNSTLADDLAVTYMGQRYEYNSNDEVEEDWLLDGEETDLVVAQNDYIEIHPASNGEIVFTRDIDSDPMEPSYNNPGDDTLLWRFNRSSSFSIKHIAGGEAIGNITVREPCSSGSWNGEECTDMFDLAAVPLGYRQSEFDTFYERTQESVQTWAEEMSPLRHDYDNPRKQIKLNFLEPENKFRPDLGRYDNEDHELSNLPVEMCQAPGPFERCPHPVASDADDACAVGGSIDLLQTSTYAVRQSQFAEGFDNIIGVYKGSEMTSFEPWGETTEPVVDAIENKNLKELTESPEFQTDDYKSCADTRGRSIVIAGSQSNMQRARAIGHELAHTRGICHTPGRIKDGECDTSAHDYKEYHMHMKPACINNPDRGGENDIMNYCDSSPSDDRYWGDPEVGGDPEDTDLPYANMRQILRYHIEGEEPPGGIAERAIHKEQQEDVEESGVVERLENTERWMSERGSSAWDTISDTVDRLNPWSD